MRRRTRASLRAFQSSPGGQEAQDLVSSVVSTPSVASAIASGQEAMAHNESIDRQIEPTRRDSSATYALPEESSPSSTQQKLLDRADAGDLQARLELVSPYEMESELAWMRRRDKPD
jgi:hypothetical protein